ncbi:MULTISPECIES: sulfite exporter TauE/SafE family protein [unclassified Crossiella]|uniref:sulfite exporter TauE/SafE family protein n=1 Tax=unclassified Crossiella TaxID=2620835 RepID=UPI001FFF2EFF|nr:MULTISPECIES: sulfite exporter TauE/SafE family protein [unclassified Crossiella]MCK2237656.1 sulfite exporter TauE/SafE family protein [Crossiella sp. S99.2]MCK2254942.1 sulfite exporter TauE/SafE family protein [Crossiella sp. S99.1]
MPAAEPTAPERPHALRLMLIGLAAGVLAGLFGVGGGIVIVPALTALCGRNQRQAVGTSVMAIGPLAIAGMVGYLYAGEVDVYIAVPLALGTMIGAWLGAALLDRVPLALLRWLYAVLALATAIRFLTVPGVFSGPVEHDLLALSLLIPVGVPIGVLAGLTGIGGSTAMVPVMQLGYGVGAAMAKGTSLLVVLPSSVLGAWRNARNGNGSLRDAAWIGGAGALTAIGTSFLSVALDPRLSDLLFGGLLVLVSIRTVWPDIRRKGTRSG